MGTMQATCGHQISVEYMLHPDFAFYAKDFTREGERALSYRTACAKCRAQYAKEKQILYTEQDKQRWLRRGKNGKRKTKS